jgi:NAD(P)-dependent dehydrogenase (short-subunit alcohol dehydrogenase family)
MAAYTAAKHRVVGLTKNAAVQYARRSRLGTPEEVAQSVAFLLSDEAAC